MNTYTQMIIVTKLTMVPNPQPPDLTSAPEKPIPAKWTTASLIFFSITVQLVRPQILVPVVPSTPNPLMTLLTSGSILLRNLPKLKAVPAIPLPFREQTGSTMLIARFVPIHPENSILDVYAVPDMSAPAGRTVTATATPAVLKTATPLITSAEAARKAEFVRPAAASLN